jgi:hypothetical protein
MPKQRPQRAGIKASGPGAGAGAGSSKKAKGAKKQAATATAARLIDQAQQALAFDDFDTALMCLSEAVGREPGNLEALDAYGSLLAELGRVEEAVQVRDGWSWGGVYAGEVVAPLGQPAAAVALYRVSHTGDLNPYV